MSHCSRREDTDTSEDTPTQANRRGGKPFGMNSPFVLQTKSLAGLGSQSQSQSQGQSRVHSQGSQGKSRHKGTCKTRGKGAGRQLNLALSQVTLGSPVEGMLLSASKGVHVPHREDNHNIVLEGCTQSQDFFW